MLNDSVHLLAYRKGPRSGRKASWITHVLQCISNAVYRKSPRTDI